MRASGTAAKEGCSHGSPDGQSNDRSIWIRVGVTRDLKEVDAETGEEASAEVPDPTRRSPPHRSGTEKNGPQQVRRVAKDGRASASRQTQCAGLTPEIDVQSRDEGFTAAHIR